MTKFIEVYTTYATGPYWVITLRPRQNGRHFPYDIFKWIFSNKNVWISIKISLKFVARGPINNIPALVQIMAWRRPGDKPLSEPMMVRWPAHICVTQSQWVNMGNHDQLCRQLRHFNFKTSSVQKNSKTRQSIQDTGFRLPMVSNV